MAREERRSADRPTRRREREVNADAARSQFGVFASGSGDLTSEGGFGTLDRYGGPLRRHDDQPSAPARHATDAGPGAPGREGITYEGDHTWGEGGAHRESPLRESGRRADESVREEVLDQLDAHSEIEAAGIEVLVEEGELTLQGTVPDRDMRRLAEGVAESVAGVSLVHNRLRLARP